MAATAHTGDPGPTESGPVAATGGRTALLTALGVPEAEWEAIDALCGLEAADDSPAANAARGAIARLGAPERAERLGPVLEQNRQRVLTLLGTVVGGTKVPLAPPAPRLDVARMAGLAAALGREGQGRAIALAQWLWNRGIHHDGLLAKFVEHFVQNHARIGNPHAYYNPGRPGFEIIKARLAGDAATEEHRALLAAEATWVKRVKEA